MQLKGAIQTSNDDPPNEFIEEYKKRHDGTDPHWDGPKAFLHAALVRSGVTNYSISYCKSTNQLFAYAELLDPTAFTATAETMDCAIWWKYFDEWGGMRYNENPGTTKLGGRTPWSEPLIEVFHMD